MSDAELRLVCDLDDDGTVRLIATARSGAFAGRGSAWFDQLGLKQKFVAALRQFPLSDTEPPAIEGGFWSKEKPEALAQCHLRIVVRPFDIRGTLLVHVDLATETWNTPDKDNEQAVTVRFLTEYAAIDRFASSLEAMINGTCDEALLFGTTKRHR